MAQWECIVCGLIYDEKEGWPDDGIAPGTKWADVPDDWTCPDCGVGKDDFASVRQVAVGAKYFMQHVPRCSAATKSNFYIAFW